MDTADSTQTYHVVINHEEQYSVWPTGRPIPDGWNAIGPTGSKDTCLDFIEKNWKDMRPLSLRKARADAATDPTYR